MPFWKCYYHVVWATKDRQPVITSPIEKVVFAVVRSKSEELQCTLLAVNGTKDHIHVAVCIRPSISVGDWAGQIKGASSHAVNLAFDELETKFRWQEQYGVVTFGEKNLPFVTSYIHRQKEHHQTGRLHTSLERTED